MKSKVYFNSGDLVVVEGISGPVMKVRRVIIDEMEDVDGRVKRLMRGVECYWFEGSYLLRDAVFSSKDLIHV